MKNPYAAGRRAEYKCVQQLKREGFNAVRTAGSHGPFDVVAWNRAGVRFIQVKKTKDFLRISPILTLARRTFEDADFPIWAQHAVEIWIHHQGRFFIYPHPFATSTGDR